MSDQGFHSDEQKRAWAEDYAAWMKAYGAAGFSRKEALQLICRPVFTLQQQGAQMSPEQAELYERLNAVLTRQLAENE